MDLVILHYHLNRGGVTRVVENHLKALTLQPSVRPDRIFLIHGGRAHGWNDELTVERGPRIQSVTIPQLDYDINHPTSPTELTSALRTFLAEHNCLAESTVVHVHNHNLGKNSALPRSLVALAQEGWPLLLHLHDFAEDLRPENYQHLIAGAGTKKRLQDLLYPQAQHIHYAVLNRRDFDLLSNAGVATNRLHLLPNPVDPPKTQPTQRARQAARTKLRQRVGVPLDHAYVLYPVRAIRRKNLGEVLLWSAALDHASLGVTLAPINPAEIPAYTSWVEFSQSLRLPVHFNVGEHLSLEENFCASDAIITTSVAEGFGMVYLEAAQAGRPLVGRSLPGVTDDFIAAGMRFPGLSDRLSIPASWIDVQRLIAKHVALATELAASYGLDIGATESLPSIVGDIFRRDEVDFGRLDSAEQRRVIGRVAGDSRAVSTLRRLNPLLDQHSIGAAEVRVTIEHNRDVIEQRYSLGVNGEQLAKIYHTILSDGPGPIESGFSIAASLLERFVQPDRILPIRLES